MKSIITVRSTPLFRPRLPTHQSSHYFGAFLPTVDSPGIDPYHLQSLLSTVANENYFTIPISSSFTKCSLLTEDVSLQLLPRSSWKALNTVQRPGSHTFRPTPPASAEQAASGSCTELAGLDMAAPRRTLRPGAPSCLLDKAAEDAEWAKPPGGTSAGSRASWFAHPDRKRERWPVWMWQPYPVKRSWAFRDLVTEPQVRRWMYAVMSESDCTGGDLRVSPGGFVKSLVGKVCGSK